jgi:hypothetical protein
METLIQMQTTTPIENFSAGYYVIDADVTPYGGDTVTIANETMRDLLNYVEQPLLKLGDSHYAPKPEAAVPRDTVAVPNYVDDGVNEVLLAKDA